MKINWNLISGAICWAIPITFNLDPIANIMCILAGACWFGLYYDHQIQEEERQKKMYEEDDADL